MKACTKCGKTKPLSEFQIRSDTGKHRNECRSCRSNQNLERYYNRPETKAAHGRAQYKHSIKRYGISIEQYDRMLEAQGGVCLICKERCSVHSRLAVDHDHVTGKVRGLLCLMCNTGLGKFKDNPALLVRAAEYLGGSNGEIYSGPGERRSP